LRQRSDTRSNAIGIFVPIIVGDFQMLGPGPRDLPSTLKRSLLSQIQTAEVRQQSRLFNAQIDRLYRLLKSSGGYIHRGAPKNYHSLSASGLAPSGPARTRYFADDPDEKKNEKRDLLEWLRRRARNTKPRSHCGGLPGSGKDKAWPIEASGKRWRGRGAFPADLLVAIARRQREASR